MTRLRRTAHVVLLVGSFLGCANQQEVASISRASEGVATVASDKPDYRPGDTAILSGSGWTAGEDVALDIECTCGCVAHLATSADDGGAFDGVLYPITEEHLGATCSVTATGATSGEVAVTTFTDGNIQVIAAPSGTTFHMTAELVTGDPFCAGAGVAQCPSGGCPVSSTTSASFAANSQQVLKMHVPATSEQGGPFVKWTDINDATISDSRDLCIAGGGDFIYRANYACVAPTITCPASINLNTAPGTCAATATYAPTFTACGATTATCSVASGSSFAKGVTAVTCTATNSANQKSSCTFNVTVADNQAPTITCPADSTNECPLDPNQPASASDNCPGATVSRSDVTTPHCGGTSDVARTFTATDGAGRTASCTQHLSFVDTGAPTVSAPPRVDVECLADVSPAATGTATAGDTCSSASVAYEDSMSAGCGQTMVITRQWTATDACGNQASAPQIIATQDTTPPALTAPADAHVECSGDTSPASRGEGTASDQCSLVTVSHADSFAPACGGSGVLTRAWTATDECGLTTSKTQTITVEDNTPPSLTVPDTATVECGSGGGAGQGAASDTCSGSVNVSSTDAFAPACGQSGTLVRTFTATDACGNSSTGAQTVHVVDTTAPSIAVPPAVTVECGASTAPDATGSAQGADQCGGVTVGSSDSFAPSCGGAGVITRTFTVTDECGHPTSATQSIAVVDTAPPAVTLAGDAAVQVECGGAYDDAGASASDGCQGQVPVIATGSVDVAVPGTYEVSYAASDGCNTTTVTRQVTVVDNQAPQITCPEEEVIHATCDGGANFVVAATASDSCGAATVTCTENGQPVAGTLGVGTHQISCVATDAAGHQSSCGYPVEVIATGADIVFRPPLTEDQPNAFEPGQVIPVKIAAVGCGGKRLSTNVRAILTVDGYAVEMGRTGTTFHYNLDTSGLTGAASHDVSVRLLSGETLLTQESVTITSQ